MKTKNEFICAFGFTALALGLCALVALAASACSLAEWQDIANDAVTQAPGQAIGLYTDVDANGNPTTTNPSETDLTSAAISFVAGLASGWYGRKFKDKKYAKRPPPPTGAGRVVQK